MMVDIEEAKKTIDEKIKPKFPGVRIHTLRMYNEIKVYVSFPSGMAYIGAIKADRYGMVDVKEKNL